MLKLLRLAPILFSLMLLSVSCQTSPGGGEPPVDCTTKPNDPKCKPKLGPVKLKVEVYKGGKKCTDLLKCAAYSDGKDSVEVRATATRRDATTKTDVPAKDQKIRFSVELPKDYEGETPLSLSCTESCVTGEDGVTKTLVTSNKQTGVELPIKAEVQEQKSRANAKTSVRFKEPAPQVTATVQDGKILLARGSSDEAVIQATVLLGTTTPPSGAAISFSADKTDDAGFVSSTTSTTLAKSVSVSLDSNGTALAKLRSKTGTGKIDNTYVSVEVSAAFGTTSASAFVSIIVGTGPAAVLSADKTVADADGSSAIKLKASVVDKAGARLKDTLVRFTTEAGFFQNRSKSYEVTTDSNGDAQATLVSLQPSSGKAQATVVPILDGCGAGCKSQTLIVTFVGTALSCDIAKIGRLELAYEGCPAGPEVTPCRVQNADDESEESKELKENEVVILARALDTTSKPISNAVIRYCTCLPHRVETSTGGTIAATDGAGLARITFKAGFQPGTTGVLAYVGCPSVDPCEEMCEDVSGTAGESSEIKQKQIPVIVTSSTGYTIEFDDKPVVISVLGTGKDTAEIKITVKDKFGNPVKDETEVRFYIVKGGGGETLPSPSGAKAEESFAETINGVASTFLRAGTVPGNVQIAADVALPGDSKITAVAQNIIIQAGPPVTDHFGLARKPVNIIGFLLYGEKVDVTAFTGDRYGNPPTPGTSIFFATEAGIIEAGGGKEINATGSVTAAHVSAEPRPRILGGSDNDANDARVTIVSYTKGSEGFLDIDGDGVYFEDMGCFPGQDCVGITRETSCAASPPTPCKVDPAEGNGCWDPCDDRGALPRNGICELDEFACDDANRDGNCSAEEAARPKVCRLGEDVFCILCTAKGSCGSGELPTTGYSKLRHKDSAGRDITKMPDKACIAILHDLGEPFINYDESTLGDADYPGRDLEEIFFDLNANGAYDPPNGKFDSSNAPVWSDIFVLWSDALDNPNDGGDSFANYFYVLCKPRTAAGSCTTTGCTSSNTEFLIADKCAADFNIYLSDWRLGPVVAGCQLTVTFPTGQSTSGSGTTTGCTNPTQTAPSFTVPDCMSSTAGCTTFGFTFTDPDICNASASTIDATIKVDLSGCKNLGPSGSGKISASINGKYQ